MTSRRAGFSGAFGEPTLALIAHDAKKDDLLALARANRQTLSMLSLIATGTTGRALFADLGLPIELMSSGPRGGDLQIGARIVEERIDAVIFLRDPLTAHPHEPDIQALLKVCDIHDIPVATNLASAELVLRYLADQIETARLEEPYERLGQMEAIS